MRRASTPWQPATTEARVAMPRNGVAGKSLNVQNDAGCSDVFA